MPSSESPSPQPDLPQPLYHLGYTLPADKPHLRNLLQQTRYLLLCGTETRALALSQALNPSETTFKNHCLTPRYVLYCPTPQVIVAAHGIGTGSIDTLLHELHIALTLAKAHYAIIRIGSCGGLGVSAGTLVVTRQPLDGMFRPQLTVRSLGEEIVLSAQLHAGLSDALFERAVRVAGRDSCVMGDTLSAETFYVAQGRCDGSFAFLSHEERLERLGLCQRKGVVNIEMESLALAAFAKQVNVPAAVLCAVLVNRLEGETPVEGEVALKRFVDRAVEVVADFVAQSLREGSEWRS